MDTLSHFRTIEELVKALEKEKELLKDMFERRKTMAYRVDVAMEVVDYKREKIQFLIDHGVIHENGDFLEMEDVYIQFFEDVLDVNEEISVTSVKEYIDSLKENIDYFLVETNEQRRFAYQVNVRKILRKIGLRTLKNIVDLKRSVDVAYKQEPNYKIKKSRLKNLDEKRLGIKVLIQECERVMDKENVFFKIAADPDMQRTCMDVRNDFTEADTNLIEIERQIIDYINQIELQSALYKKIRRLKYLKDQLTWSEDTNVKSILQVRNPLWMEPRRNNRTLLSVDRLRGDENLTNIIRNVAKNKGLRQTSRTKSEPVDNEFFEDSVQEVPTVNTIEMWNAFKAQSGHLFSFIMNYNYKQPRKLNDHIILYCQLAVQHCDEIRVTDEYETFENIEYALIYAK